MLRATMAKMKLLRVHQVLCLHTINGSTFYVFYVGRDRVCTLHVLRTSRTSVHKWCWTRSIIKVEFNALMGFTQLRTLKLNLLEISYHKLKNSKLKAIFRFFFRSKSIIFNLKKLIFLIKFVPMFTSFVNKKEKWIIFKFVNQLTAAPVVELFTATMSLCIDQRRI